MILTDSLELYDMNRPKNEQLAPCIICEGTIYHKKDMLRALETFENLRYEYVVDGRPVAQGKGILLKVFASKNSATLIINNNIFVNVLSFRYLNFRTRSDGQTEIELMADSRNLKLISVDEDVKPFKSNRESLPTVDQFDDEETFALLEDGESDEED